ncbi:hypothetical protein L3X38_026617 [Prunus dulcis]|uniref:Uncharacterized protein n=1 Tax=Prunus dulcis TaxID=3755 RepID=A0AAD4VMA2_PRUDU|nr:hypothetical protein L3X38_026617 [Prunus dulcis]
MPTISKIVFRKLWKDLLQIRRNQLPDGGGRKLTDDEKVSLCSEFLLGGTDTSITTLQWVMANLVKNQDIQKKLLDEINSVVKPKQDIA